MSTLLFNAPDQDLVKLLYELSPPGDEVLRYCSNAGLECVNFNEYLHGDFHKCYEYSISGEKTEDEMFTQGMANGWYINILFRDAPFLQKRSNLGLSRKGLIE